jgi:Xaa-Pro aminopeptidase
MLQDRLTAEDPLGSSLSRQKQFLAHLLSRVPTGDVRNLTPIVDELRLIKSPAEMKLMRKAGQLSAQMLVEAMKVTRPGIGENTLEAIGLYVFKAGGAKGAGYKTIAPSGHRIWDPHYIENTETLVDGELVLMDGAPDVGGYTSDIGRMWPVNGKYSPEQRELYGYVVRLHEETLKRIRPGVTAQQIIDEVKVAMLPVWEATAWSKPSFKDAALTLLDFRGTFSHTVGLTVHDSCNYWGRPLEPGMVFTIDPQLWVRDERIYIRVEDTVAVTETGVEILTEGPPRDLDATEVLVGTGSLWI